MRTRSNDRDHLITFASGRKMESDLWDKNALQGEHQMVRIHLYQMPVENRGCATLRRDCTATRALGTWLACEQSLQF